MSEIRKKKTCNLIPLLMLMSNESVRKNGIDEKERERERSVRKMIHSGRKSSERKRENMMENRKNMMENSWNIEFQEIG